MLGSLGSQAGVHLPPSVVSQGWDNPGDVQTDTLFKNISLFQTIWELISPIFLLVNFFLKKGLILYLKQ